LEISRKNCCAPVMGLVYGLVAPGMLANDPDAAGADYKAKPADHSFMGKNPVLALRGVL
jgi:hypothetical protein